MKKVLVTILSKYWLHILLTLLIANIGLWYSLRYVSRAATPNVCFTPAQIASAWVPTDPVNPNISKGTGHCYYVFQSETRSGTTISYPQYTVFEKYSSGTTYTVNSRPHQGVVCGSCVDPTHCPGMGLPYTQLDSVHFNPLAGQLNYLAGKEVGYVSLSCGVSPSPIPSPTIQPTYRTCMNLTCTTVVGVGTNQCNNDPDCVPTPTLTPIPPTPPISVWSRSDIVVNSRVDIFDYNAMVSDFGCPGRLSPVCPTNWNTADIIVNGRVDIFDYNAMVSDFGCPSRTSPVCT